LNKRAIYGYIFVLFYLAALIKPYIPLIIYYLDYDRIVTEECINRDKPYLRCNGKCYVEAIKKRLGDENLPKQNMPVSINVKEFPLAFCEDQSELTIFDFSDVSHSYWVFQIKPKGVINDIFRPPQAA
jgi:hypothetical protein